MKRERFEELRKNFNDTESALLGYKRVEYASDDDVLVNFREAAAMLYMTPEKYCLVLATKHYHAIMRAVEAGRYKWCWADESGEGLMQRIADLRNLFVLLAALIDEDLQAGDEPR